MQKPTSQNTETLSSRLKTPIGIIAVLIFMTIEFFMLTRLLMTGYMLPIANLVLSKGMAFAYLTLSIGILASMIFGTLKRKTWARTIGMGWYIYNAVLTVINYATFQWSSENLLPLYQQFNPEGEALITTQFVSTLLLISMIFVCISGGIITFYLYKKKAYFNV